MLQWFPVVGLITDCLQRWSPVVLPIPVCTYCSTHQEGGISFPSPEVWAGLVGQNVAEAVL